MRKKGEEMREDPEARDAVPLRKRLLVAVLIGLATGLYACFLYAREGFWPDFVYPWAAARHLLAGVDPYLALPGGQPEPFQTPLFYPLPTALAVIPVAGLPLPLAGGIVLGFSGALLAFVLMRRGMDHLWMLVGAPFIMAVNCGQWSALIAVAALVPACGWMATLKPNLGLAALAYRPSWTAAFGCLAMLGLSVAVLPAWPLEWLSGLDSLESHPPPVLSVGGVGLLLLLAALRWRTPEGRLLLVMACVPQLLFFADQLPLALVARTRRQIQLLNGCGFAAYGLWLLSLERGDRYVMDAEPFVLALLYLPALGMVLRHPPVEAPAPDWLRRVRGRILRREGSLNPSAQLPA